MHLPGCFSVNSALSRPSILPGCLMSQQSLPCRPPPPTYTFIIRVLLFSLQLEGNACLLNKAKTNSPFSRAYHSTTDVVEEREMSHPLVLRSPFCLDYIWEDSLHMVEHISNADRPLSFPQWILFLLLIHQPPEMKIALRQDGAYPGLFNGCQGTLSFWWFGQE